MKHREENIYKTLFISVGNYFSEAFFITTDDRCDIVNGKYFSIFGKIYKVIFFYFFIFYSQNSENSVEFSACLVPVLILSIWEMNALVEISVIIHKYHWWCFLLNLLFFPKPNRYFLIQTHKIVVVLEDKKFGKQRTDVHS